MDIKRGRASYQHDKYMPGVTVFMSPVLSDRDTVYSLLEC